MTDRVPTSILPEGRLLNSAEFHKLADVPPEVEWFANLTNPSTRRAYAIVLDSARNERFAAQAEMLQQRPRSEMTTPPTSPPG